MPNKTKTPKPHKNIRGAEYYAQCIKEQKETTPIQRLREFVQWAQNNGLCHTFNEFEVRCGLGKSYITKSYANNSKGDISSAVLAKIVKAFPMFNLYWICTGEGKMIGEETRIDYYKAYRKKCRELEIANSKLEDIGEIINKK